MKVDVATRGLLSLAEIYGAVLKLDRAE